MWHPLRFLVFALVAAGATGCEDGGRACYPRDYERCACAGEAQGYRQCDAAGSEYGTCDCSGTIPGLTTAASTGAGGAGAGGGGGASGGTGGTGGAGTGGTGGGEKLPFLSPCANDDECDTGLCFHFNGKGPHCSMPCEAAADCPAPSPGCSLMGVCKLP
jgi:hypothetical protein